MKVQQERERAREERAERREFFFATPTEVRELLAEKVGGLLEFNEKPEAPEYFQSRGLWPKLDS